MEHRSVTTRHRLGPVRLGPPRLRLPPRRQRATSTPGCPGATTVPFDGALLGDGGSWSWSWPERALRTTTARPARWGGRRSRSASTSGRRPRVRPGHGPAQRLSPEVPGRAEPGPRAGLRHRRDRRRSRAVLSWEAAGVLADAGLRRRRRVVLHVHRDRLGLDERSRRRWPTTTTPCTSSRTGPYNSGSALRPIRGFLRNPAFVGSPEVAVLPRGFLALFHGTSHSPAAGGLPPGRRRALRGSRQDLR